MPNRLKNKFFYDKAVNEFLSGSFWSLVGDISSKFLLFLVWLFVARILGKELYGEIGIIRSTVNLFAIFIGTGISITMTKYIPMYLKTDKKRTNSIYSLNLFFTLTFSVLLTFILFLFAGELSLWISGSKDLKQPLRIGSFLIFFNSLNNFIKGSLQGFKSFRLISLISILNGLSTFVFVYFGTKWFSVNGAFYGLLLSAAVLFIQGFFYLKKKLQLEGIRFSFNFSSEYRILKNFSIPLILSGLMVVPFKWALDAFLVKSENGFNELGLFSALILFQTFLIVLANALNAPLLTLMAENGNNNRINKINLYAPLFLGVVAVTPFLFFPEAFGFFLGDDFVGDPNYEQTMLLILITTVLILYKQGIARIMVINNLMWFSFFSNLLWGIVLLITFKIFELKDSRTFAFSYFVAYLTNILIIAPYYTHKGIIPQDYVNNKPMFFLWALIALIGIAKYFNNFSFAENILGLLVCIGFLTIIFYRLIKNKA